MAVEKKPLLIYVSLYYGNYMVKIYFLKKKWYLTIFALEKKYRNTIKITYTLYILFHFYVFICYIETFEHPDLIE